MISDKSALRAGSKPRTIFSNFGFVWQDEVHIEEPFKKQFVGTAAAAELMGGGDEEQELERWEPPSLGGASAGGGGDIWQL